MSSQRGARLPSWAKGLFASAIILTAGALILPSQPSMAQSPGCPNSNDIFCGYWTEYIGGQWVQVPVTYAYALPEE
jgi:hypothetical protein